MNSRTHQLLPDLEVVPNVELRRPRRSAVANRAEDQERRRITTVAGRVVEVRAVRDVEDVEVRPDPFVPAAGQPELVLGTEAQQREVGAARAVEAALVLDCDGILIRRRAVVAAGGQRLLEET